MSEPVGKRKVVGWEEAGFEFYQESYNSDDGVLKTTQPITTLLPSKQNRFETNKRPLTKSHENRAQKYRQTSAQTVQKTQNPKEVHFSALPDLSQILTDEERIWEEMLLIKLMPAPMNQKKSLKDSLQNTTKLRLQGFNQFKWKHRKAWQKFSLRCSEILSKLELWKSSLKHIGGNFGTGVEAYFLFLRWLFFLNFFTFILIILFIVLPNIIQESYLISERCEFLETDENCSSTLAEKEQVKFNILDIVQGSGMFQSSLMFYGAYSNEVFPANENDEIYSNLSQNSVKELSKPLFHYNMTLAYIFVNLAYFFVVLIAIVRAAAREFKDRLVNGKWQFFQHCNLVFGGWDFCIHNAKSAVIKHKAIKNEIKFILHTKRIEMERISRSADLIYRIVLLRVMVNITVFSILIISAFVIYYLLNLSLLHQHYFEKQNFKEIQANSTYYRERDFSKPSNSSHFSEKINDMEEKIVTLLFDFIPFIAIVVLNLFVPIIFNYLVTFEKYSPLFVIKISLFRTIFLRLSSFGVLLSRFYYIVVPQQNMPNSDVQIKCWETFIGQQFYKLVLTDFFSHLLVTFCINFPRALCARNVNSNIIRFIGEQEFCLPKHVLDIVYIQAICWLGSFYSPLMPGIVTIITFFMFYIKKFQCLVNSKPSQIFYGTSRTNSLFMFVLLLSFFVALVPITYSIAEVKPSLTCGPFKGLATVWDAPLIAFTNMPIVIKNIFFFFGTAAFAIPCFVILTLLLYYFYAVSDANKNMVEVLKNQLVLEGHDKQFLLTRLSVFLKQQQEINAVNATRDTLN